LVLNNLHDRGKDLRRLRNVGSVATPVQVPFKGHAFALRSDGLATVSINLGMQAPQIWTVLADETCGCGFLPDRRPQILYERQVFHRLTQGRYDDGDISASQYDRLAKAIAKDRIAPLASASWGIGQIMGENDQLAGFKDVEQMVAKMTSSRSWRLF
jgi:hypothetical protein